LAKKSGLQVTSIPQATVFLDGNSLGSTPVREEDLSPGEHTVKLVPQDPALEPYEAKINLTPGVLTAIDRTLAISPQDAHGFTLSFEPLNNKRDVVLDVATVPEAATISVDGSAQGFTPRSLDNITAGDHVIVFSSPGYINKTVRAKAISGYKLTVSVQLAKAAVPALPTPEATDSAELALSPTPSGGESANIAPTISPTIVPTKTPTPSPSVAGSSTPAKPYVEILETNATGDPCGTNTWLNVRTEPPAGEVITKVCTGDTFPYLNETKSGWYKIEYAASKEGWVSSQYAELVK
jgi:hypothetical protein